MLGVVHLWYAQMDNTVTNMAVDTTGGHLTLEESFTRRYFLGSKLDHPNYDVEEYTILLLYGKVLWTSQLIPWH